MRSDEQHVLKGCAHRAFQILLIDNRTAEDPKVDYAASVNRAIDHIVQNLGGPLRLEDVAAAAHFSPFHFHRVFKAMMGETLAQFVKRHRLERALKVMSHGKDKPLTQVALECGFSSSSDFSRSFKQRYGVPPSVFDIQTWRDDRRSGSHASSDRVEQVRLPERLPPGENPDGFEVTLRDLPARRVAYVRVLDPYQGTGVVEAAERLMEWADERGVADGQWLGYMWEDPEIVALADCRYDVGVVVAGKSEPVLLDGDVGLYEFAPMRVAEISMAGDIELEMRLLDWLYGTWLPRSDYIPDDQPCFEAWHGRPFAHGHEHFELSAQLPVVRG